MITALVSIGGLLLSAFTYMIGRSISESEKILAEKRRIYEEFLRRCPEPNEAYENSTNDTVVARRKLIAQLHPIISLYASPDVAMAIGRYYELFEQADIALTPDSPPLHQAFQAAAKAHNDIILEMRRDAFSWSAFGHRGPSRLGKKLLKGSTKTHFKKQL